MKKIMLVFGTRPEAVKMCPLVNELKKRKTFDVSVLVTGQHRELLSSVLARFNITPDYDLDIMENGQTLFDVTEKVMNGARDVLEKARPDVVLVHGDTTTAFAAALAAFYLHIPVGHIEAGLRTYDIYSPYPEEFNRNAVDFLSYYHFAPTELCRKRLIAEGRDKSRVFVTGNTVIDAVKSTVVKDFCHPALDFAKGRKLILVTAHRRENLGANMKDMLSGIKRALSERPDFCAVYPMHPNPAVVSAAKEVFEGFSGVMLIPALDVFDFHNIMARSHLIVSDSGGVQEEAPAFGVPVLVMRDTTERPEGIEAGTVRLIGNSGESVYRGLCEVLDRREEYEKMAKSVNPYGDGFASVRIADILENADVI